MPCGTRNFTRTVSNELERSHDSSLSMPILDFPPALARVPARPAEHWHEPGPASETQSCHGSPAGSCSGQARDDSDLSRAAARTSSHVKENQVSGKSSTFPGMAAQWKPGPCQWNWGQARDHV
jgi:hypothetical protein